MKLRPEHIRIIAEVLSDESTSRRVLYDIDFPIQEIIHWDNSVNFWTETCLKISNGILPNGNVLSLIDAVIRMFGSNQELIQLRHFYAKGIYPKNSQEKALDFSHKKLGSLTLPEKADPDISYTIDATDNRLRRLPAKFGSFKFVTVVLSENCFYNFPKELHGLDHLTRLDFNFNKLDKLTNEIMRLKNLESLSLNANEIRTIDQGVYYLERLQYLNLNRNRLKTPWEKFDLDFKNNRIQTLDFSHNEIHKIPPGLELFTELWYLNISHNDLKYLPDALPYLDSLSELYLAGNPLKYIPEELGNIRGLRVYVDDNILKILPKSMLLNPEIEIINQSPTPSVENLSLLTLLTYLSSALGIDLSQYFRGDEPPDDESPEDDPTPPGQPNPPKGRLGNRNNHRPDQLLKTGDNWDFLMPGKKRLGNE